MTTVSPSILDAISMLTPEDDRINYVQLVELKNIQWYLALGRECFYFFTLDLKKYKDPPIPY